MTRQWHSSRQKSVMEKSLVLSTNKSILMQWEHPTDTPKEPHSYSSGLKKGRGMQRKANRSSTPTLVYGMHAHLVMLAETKGGIQSWASPLHLMARDNELLPIIRSRHTERKCIRHSVNVLNMERSSNEVVADPSNICSISDSSCCCPG